MVIGIYLALFVLFGLKKIYEHVVGFEFVFTL